MLIPVGEFEGFKKPVGSSYELTCKNHPTAQYYSKNPWSRGLHFIKAAVEFAPGQECPCPFADLVVVVDADA